MNLDGLQGGQGQGGGQGEGEGEGEGEASMYVNPLGQGQAAGAVSPSHAQSPGPEDTQGQAVSRVRSTDEKQPGRTRRIASNQDWLMFTSELKSMMKMESLGDYGMFVGTAAASRATLQKLVAAMVPIAAVRRANERWPAVGTSDQDMPPLAALVSALAVEANVDMVLKDARGTGASGETV